MNKSNALTLVILVVVTLLFQGCAYHDPTHVWCVSYSCRVTCESGPCSESCGHAMWHGSPEECKAEGGTGYKHYNYANNEFLRRNSEKYTSTSTPASKPKSSQPSKSKSKTSCNSSSLNSHQRWQCATKKCLKYQMLLSLGGGNTSGWMAKCMALRGNSWPASGSRSSCTGPYCKYESAWDYLPGSREWRCRDTGGARGGEFVPSSECSSQKQLDNWP